MDQLAASWKESVHESGCPGGKTRQIFSTFSLFSSVFVRMVDVGPDVSFDVLGVSGKLTIPLFLKLWTCAKACLGSRDTVP